MHTYTPPPMASASSPSSQPTEPSSSSSVDLTTWFLNAKRSLSSITHCFRANSLVDFARQALHDATVISARCVFLRNALQDQLMLARRINQMMHALREGSKGEFEKTLAELDNADHRLNQTLEVLRNSVVDPAFNPSAGGTSETEEVDVPVRSLHDFVEDEGIENLKSKLRHSIDQVQESHDDFLSALTSFDELLETLSTTLSAFPTPTTPPLHPYLLALEDHAESMAHLLDSLTCHYDRCSSALRTSSLESPTSDLYAVLSRDAAQVDDVVAELKDRLTEMESISIDVKSVHTTLLDTDRAVVEAVETFESFSGRLSGWLERSRVFEVQQEEYANAMGERLSELWGLGDFYEGFAGAYDRLVLEVARRKGVAVRMEGVVREAVGRLRSLFEEDLAERETFRATQGEHLPIDIWPGVMDPPVRYVITKEGNELPDIAKEVIEKALRKTQGKSGV